MERDILKNEINNTTASLVQLAEENCWNIISKNYLYILSDYNEFKNYGFYEERKVRKKINSRKKPQKLDQVIKVLGTEYSDLYDVNLYILESKKNLTVIEIQYYRKSNLDKEYFEKVKDNQPMFHAKISLPAYAKDSTEKFDINWERGGLINIFKIIFWDVSYKIRTRKLKK
ncbi:CRISPR/Cas system-associated endonuclease/helicase Cas3 [Chryseobacterium sp. H1D6B]|uniref:hypothetical protein n=1 Tax=Chryseobacterium sp. H1D6B TaxID=2940588 RepID=UPI0015CA49D0|nr:hypothetical protein [Chryseobacterium sp. H1D6B]MDH6253522.1 CRISPR/Cas system-associated endonuclease/helicase Cas3 [Chryseobacterium sp. H1D6B]